MVDTHSIQREILLPYTKLDWSSANGDVPVSPVFDDVYFSVQDGVAESFEHFIVGNDLINRFSALPDNAHFTILETGFGSGLNFILTADLFLKHAPKTAHLHFVSVEGYPLSPLDMEKILSLALNTDGANELDIDTSLIQQLLSIYPVPCRGFHRDELSGDKSRVDLTLYMGKMDDFVPALHSYDCGVVDAVFLDGFAPAKNPDMWQDALFNRLPELMKTGGTIATFTAAGFVRRGLQDVGFTMSKTRGYGRKRERLIGVYNNDKPNHTAPQKIAVIGAGIAGLTIAHSCQKWGADVTVFDADEKSMNGASGNPIGLIEPRLSNDNDATKHGRLNRSAYLHSVQYYDAMHQQSETPIWSCKGLIFAPKKQTEQTRIKKMFTKALLPHEHLQNIDYETAKNIAGVDAFPHIKDGDNIIAYFPQAGGLYTAHIRNYLTPKLSIQNSVKITNIEKQNSRWVLTSNNGQKTPTFDTVIICAGVDSLYIDGLPVTIENKWDILRSNRGQISWTDQISNPPKVAIGGQGYTAHNKTNNTVIFGATWDRLSPDEYAQNDWQKITPDCHTDNIKKVSDLLPELSKINSDKTQGRVSIRATVPDRMPLVGELSDNVYLATGYGARGLQYSPILSQILRNLLWKVFPPCDSETVSNLNPNRNPSKP